MRARSVTSLGILAALLTGSGLFAQSAYEAANGVDPAADHAFRDASGHVPVWAQRATVSARDTADVLDRLESRMDPIGPNPPRPISGIVTIHQLEHKVPGKAKSEFEKAVRDSEHGNRGDAIKHLTKAVKIDPEFAMARNDLAAYYLFEGKTDRAIKQLNAAIAIDPHSPMPYSNLAVAYMIENKIDAAENAARQLVELDRTGTRSHLLLGMSLVMQDKFTPEAESNLLSAEADFPQASLLLARLFAAQGRIENARQRINRYLASGEPDGAPLAHRWMKKLNAVNARADLTASQR